MPVLENSQLENDDNNITQIDFDSGSITLNRHWDHIYISFYKYTGRIGVGDLTVDDISEKEGKRFYNPELLKNVEGPIGNITDIRFNSGDTLNIQQVGNEATLHVNGEPLRIPDSTVTPPLPAIREEFTKKINKHNDKSATTTLYPPSYSPSYSPSHNTYDSLSIGTRIVDSELTVSGNVCIVGKEGSVKMKCNARDTLNIPRLNTNHINTYGLNMNNQSIVNVDVLATQVVIPELTFIYTRDASHDYCDIFEEERLLGRLGRAPMLPLSQFGRRGRIRIQTPDLSFFTEVTSGIVWIHPDRIDTAD